MTFPLAARRAPERLGPGGMKEQDDPGISRASRHARLGPRALDRPWTGDEAAAERLIVAAYESDQRALGEETGRFLAQQLKRRGGAEAAVAVYRSCAFEGCYRRVEGFRAAMDAAGVAWREVGYRIRLDHETAEEAALDLLRRHPEARVLWAANESGTLGLVHVARALGLAGQAQIFGTDSSRELAEMLLHEDNLLQAVTSQRPYEMGYRAATAAAEVLLRRAPPDHTLHTVEHRLLHRGRPEEVRALLR